jgi:hypothetical protein
MEIGRSRMASMPLLGGILESTQADALRDPGQGRWPGPAGRRRPSRRQHYNVLTIPLTGIYLDPKLEIDRPAA